LLIKLNHIATIQTGIYEKPHPLGNIKYIQGNMVNNNFELSLSNQFPMITGAMKYEKHLLRDSDILFMAKGERNVAALYKASLGDSVASSNFFVIRLRDKKILAEYLIWVFNALYNSGKMKSLKKGTHIPSISKKSLEMLEIPVPSIEIQKKIVQLQELWNREKLLTQELMNKKDQLYQRYVMEIANK